MLSIAVEFVGGDRIAAGCNFGIRPSDVSRSVVAVKLAQLVNDGYKGDVASLASGYGFDPSDGIYLQSGIDAAYLARVGDDYCAAAFRGTTKHQPADWFTNVDLDPVVFEEKDGREDLEDEMEDGGTSTETECDIHGGYHEAFAKFEYRYVVEEFLKSCRSECPDCETVLTGHSQGGGIAEISALYMKSEATDKPKEKNTNTSDIADNDVDLRPYVVTFGAPASLGAGCLRFFEEDDRRRWFRYVMATEGWRGKELVYDPIPLLYSQLLDPPIEASDSEEEGFLDSFDGFFELPIDETYARNGGLAYIGHEILLSSEDPSAVLLSEFDGHRFVDFDFLDLTGKSHYESLYSRVLETQDILYNKHKHEDKDSYKKNDDNSPSVECPGRGFLPSSGFAVGSLCNPDDSLESSTCAEGTACEAEFEGWFWETPRHTCQPLPSQTPTSTAPSIVSSSTAAAPLEEEEEDEAPAADVSSPSQAVASNPSPSTTPP